MDAWLKIEAIFLCRREIEVGTAEHKTFLQRPTSWVLPESKEFIRDLLLVTLPDSIPVLQTEVLQNVIDSRYMESRRKR